MSVNQQNYCGLEDRYFMTQMTSYDFNYRTSTNKISKQETVDSLVIASL